jgi:hypothetical protein
LSSTSFCWMAKALCIASTASSGFFVRDSKMLTMPWV